MLTTASLFLPLAGAITAPFLTRILRHNAAWVLALFLLMPLAIFAGHVPSIAAGAVDKGGFAFAQHRDIVRVFDGNGRSIRSCSKMIQRPFQLKDIARKLRSCCRVTSRSRH